MIKLVSLMWRRPGMSADEFRDHYENSHRLIGERVLAGYASHYVRRYAEPFDGNAGQADPDVVMEIWFPDRARLDAFFKSIADNPAIAAEIAEDEERLFDRDRMRSYIVDEVESAMPLLA